MATLYSNYTLLSPFSQITDWNLIASYKQPVGASYPNGVYTVIESLAPYSVRDPYVAFQYYFYHSIARTLTNGSTAVASIKGRTTADGLVTTDTTNQSPNTNYGFDLELRWIDPVTFVDNRTLASVGIAELGGTGSHYLLGACITDAGYLEAYVYTYNSVGEVHHLTLSLGGTVVVSLLPLATKAQTVLSVAGGYYTGAGKIESYYTITNSVTTSDLPPNAPAGTAYTDTNTVTTEAYHSVLAGGLETNTLIETNVVVYTTTGVTGGSSSTTVTGDTSNAIFAPALDIAFIDNEWYMAINHGGDVALAGLGSDGKSLRGVTTKTSVLPIFPSFYRPIFGYQRRYNEWWDSRSDAEGGMMFRFKGVTISDSLPDYVPKITYNIGDAVTGGIICLVNGTHLIPPNPNVPEWGIRDKWVYYGYAGFHGAFQTNATVTPITYTQAAYLNPDKAGVWESIPDHTWKADATGYNSDVAIYNRADTQYYKEYPTDADPTVTVSPSQLMEV